MRKLVGVISSLGLLAVVVVSCTKENETAFANGICDTVSMSFSINIQPIFNQNCTSCHNPTTFSGGHDFTTHHGILHAVEIGNLLAAINHSPGISAMPQGAAKLSDCNIAKITAWINQGALNN